MKQDMDLAFLPAAIEIEQTPPAPTGRAILWTILILITVAVTWSFFGRVDIVAVAAGRVIPNGHSKPVQTLESGIVSALYVSNGREVEAGELLLQLDATRVQADINRLESELSEAQHEKGRCEWLVQRLSGEESGEQFTAESATALLAYRQWREYQGRRSVLQREKARQQAELETATGVVGKLSAILPIATRRAADRRQLAEQKLLPEQDFLSAEQTRLEVANDLQTQKKRVAESKAALAALDARIDLTREEFHRQLVERRQVAMQQIARLDQELVKVRNRRAALDIRAPIAGIVQQLEVRNVGAVVTAGQDLLVVVPRDADLEVEAVLANKDIGFLQVGQRASVKVDAFPFTKYGTLDGEITDLSRDAVVDQGGGLVFMMRVLLKRPSIDMHASSVPLSPGMAVSVEATTGSRRLIEYFLSPLMRYVDESMRER